VYTDATKLPRTVQSYKEDNKAAQPQDCKAV